MEPQTYKTADAIMSGLITRAEIAKALRCTERTIMRREQIGLPVIRVGMLRLYSADAVRAWLLEHEQRPDVPRRGRPVTKRAA